MTLIYHQIVNGITSGTRHDQAHDIANKSNSSNILVEHLLTACTPQPCSTRSYINPRFPFIWIDSKLLVESVNYGVLSMWEIHKSTACLPIAIFRLSLLSVRTSTTTTDATFVSWCNEFVSSSGLRVWAIFICRVSDFHWLRSDLTVCRLQI